MIYKKIYNFDRTAINDAIDKGHKVLLVDLFDRKVKEFEYISYGASKIVMNDESGRFLIFDVYEEEQTEQEADNE